MYTDDSILCFNLQVTDHCDGESSFSQEERQTVCVLVRDTDDACLLNGLL